MRLCKSAAQRSKDMKFLVYKNVECKRSIRLKNYMHEEGKKNAEFETMTNLNVKVSATIGLDEFYKEFKEPLKCFFFIKPRLSPYILQNHKCFFSSLLFKTSKIPLVSTTESGSSSEEEYIGFAVCYDSSSNSEASRIEELSTEKREYGWIDSEEETEDSDEESDEETNEEEDKTDEEEEKVTDEEEEEEKIEENETKVKEEGFVCVCGYCF
ncbi:hypothetical protein GIB67_004893 [Kingdonia uniflora]|uniref:Uncharacterized protein n=1 Tax=Kingdonia uniflora TaxID=39325 RepID=A0A7J7LNV3_9MAGN|nr:hypothetical protein GIB67_004893 [Kingdonia uniflora]